MDKTTPPAPDLTASSAPGDALDFLHAAGFEPADVRPYWNERAKLGESDLARFEAMYPTGASTPAICRALSISSTSVSNSARRLKLPPQSKHLPLSNAQRERLRELYVTGVTSGTICRELGINHPTMLRCLKETGRPRRKRAGFGQPRHPNGKLSKAEVAELCRL